MILLVIILFTGSDIRSEDLDITLMIFLLRNIAELKIDDALPSEHRLEKIDDIARIKFYRNHIMHALEQSNCLTDSEYTQLWECVCKVRKFFRKAFVIFAITCKTAPLKYFYSVGTNN